MRPALAAALTGLLLLSACQGDRAARDDGPPPSPSPSAEIRAVDFGEQVWNVSALGFPGFPTRLPFRAGKAAFHNAALNEQVELSVVGRPTYADADFDGDSDAVVQLDYQPGNSAFSYYVLWTWQDGQAVQVVRPMADSGRCADFVERVAPAADGFEVTLRVRSGQEHGCAEDGRIVRTYTVGAWDGYAVRVRPSKGPGEWCEPARFTEEIPAVGTPALLVAPDQRAPQLVPLASVPRIALSTDEYDQFTDAGGLYWRLALARLPDGSTACGWLPPALD